MEKFAKTFLLSCAIGIFAGNFIIGQTLPVEMAKAEQDDLVENSSFPNVVRINYSGNTATLSTPPNGVTVNAVGSKVSVDSSIEGLELVLSGNSTNGSLSVKTTNKAKITLNGLVLNSNDGPAINISTGKRTFIVLNPGTTNSLGDGKNYILGNINTKGTIFSEGEIIFSGKGKLTVSGNYGHAVCSDDHLIIREGTITVQNSVKDGFHANDFILIESGIINIASTEDGIDSEIGGVRINNGELKITSTGKSTAAIKAETTVTVAGGKINLIVSGEASKGIRGKGSVSISGGTIDVTASGNAFVENGDISSAAGISSDGKVNISGATTKLAITSSGSAGKGISCDGDLLIASGTINITTTGAQFYGGTTGSVAPDPYARGGGRGGPTGLSSSSKGIKAEGNLTINGGNITSTTLGSYGSEAIESKLLLQINGGTVIANAVDDGINARVFEATGGNVYSYSTGNDGIDSNGPVTISGGLIVTSAPRGGMEGGIDCDRNTMKITGGTLISFGGTGSSPSTVSTQNSIVFMGSLNQTVHIKTSDNKEVFTIKMPMASSESITISSPKLKSNAIYTLFTGGTISGGTEQFGLYTGSTYSQGSELAKITLSSVVTFVGSSQNMYGPGGRGGFGR